jgi:predicted amidohydrolase YtcJ
VAPSKEAVADSIYFGGPIHTINDAQPIVEAVAVKDGKILAAGTKGEILELAGPSTRQSDLKGKPMLPGFVDSHGNTYFLLGRLSP